MLAAQLAILVSLVSSAFAVSSQHHRTQALEKQEAEIDEAGAVSPSQKVTATVETEAQQAAASELARLAERYRAEEARYVPPPVPPEAPKDSEPHINSCGDLVEPVDPGEFESVIEAVKWNAHLMNASVIAAESWRATANVFMGSAFSHDGHSDTADTHGVAVATKILLTLAKQSGLSLKQILHKPGTSTLTTTPLPASDGYRLLPNVERIILSAATAAKKSALASGATVDESYLLGVNALTESLQDLAWQIGTTMEEALQEHPPKGKEHLHSIPNIGGACPVPEEPPETTTTVTVTTTVLTTTVTPTTTETRTSTSTKTTTETSTSTITSTTTETTTRTETTFTETTLTTLDTDLAIR